MQPHSQHIFLNQSLNLPASAGAFCMRLPVLATIVLTARGLCSPVFRKLKATTLDAAAGTLSDQRAFLASPPAFSGFSDKTAYDGYVPSAAYLEGAYKSWFLHERTAGTPEPTEGEEPGLWTHDTHLHRSFQLLDGDVLSMDASHKFAKAIRYAVCSALVAAKMAYFEVCIYL
jgi:hypothetical protein